jgi:hypothetical protein
LIALALYAPWAPTLLRQMSEVREHFWIAAQDRAGLEQAFWRWTTGFAFATRAELCGLWVVVGAAIGYAVAARDRAMWLFLLQAVVPWGLCIAWSRLSGREIFLDRCMVFAHVGLALFLGALVARLPNNYWRLAVGWIILWTSAIAGWDWLAQRPSEPPAITRAMQRLAGEYRDGDVVLPTSATTINQLRYYAKRAGLRELEARVPLNVFAKGHQVHVASLDEQDFYIGDLGAFCDEKGYERIWTASEDSFGSPIPRSFRHARTETFTGGGNTRYELSLYERAPP